jgi:hypothetical protein
MSHQKKQDPRVTTRFWVTGWTGPLLEVTDDRGVLPRPED